MTLNTTKNTGELPVFLLVKATLDVFAAAF